MRLFYESVNKVLNEGMENGVFYVYHMTDQKAAKGGIVKSGFERYYGASKVAMSYGPGVYTTIYPSFDPRSKCTNPNLDSDIRKRYYGAAMLKCKTPGIDNFMIFDEDLAKSVYGSNYRYEDQIKFLMDPDEYNHLISTNRGGYERAIGKGFTNWINSGGVVAGAFDSVVCSRYPKSNNRIRGIIFHGGHDGYVAIFRNFLDVIPVAISYDFGRHFSPVTLDPKYYEYAANNIDIYRELGVVNQFDAQTHKRIYKYSKLPYNADYDVLPAYFLGRFARVEKDGKYNYIYRKTFKDGPISKVWFDACPERFKRSGTDVVIDGVDVVIKQNNEEKFYAYIPPYTADNVKPVFICPLRLFNKSRYDITLNTLLGSTPNNQQNNPNDSDSDDTMNVNAQDDNEEPITFDDNDFVWN